MIFAKHDERYAENRCCKSALRRKIKDTVLQAFLRGIASVLAVSAATFAAGYTWDISTASGIQAGSGTWGINNYWTIDGITLAGWPGSANYARFAGSDGSYTITVNGDQYVDSLLFDNNGYLLQQDRLNFSMQAYFRTAAGVTAVINTPLYSSSGFEKWGTGTLVLLSDDVVTGSSPTNINEGTLQIGNGGTTGMIDFTGSVQNNGTLRINHSDSVYFYSMINGSGGLEQAGTGTTILSGYNNYSGNTIISSGVLQVGDGSMGSLGTTGQIQNNGLLVFNLGSDLNISAPLSGTGGFALKGYGKVIFSGNNACTGPTNVTQGGITVNGTTAAGNDIFLFDSSVVGGNGVIGGNVTLAQGAKLSPGDYSAAKLTTGSVTLCETSKLLFDIGTTGDTLAVQGDLILDGILNLADVGGVTEAAYTIMTVTGTITDNGLAIGTTPPDYYCSVSVGTNTVSVTLSLIPVREWTGGGGNNRWSTPGNWSGSVVPTSADSVVFLSAAAPCSLDVAAAVRSLYISSGFTQNFYLNHKTLTITNAFSELASGAIVADSLDTICFDGPSLHSFLPYYNEVLPVLHQKGSGPTDVSGSFICRGLHISGGVFRLGNWFTDTVQTVVVENGTLDFVNSRLVVKGNADLDGASAIVSNSEGTMEFYSAGQQKFIPGVDKPHPKIENSSTGTLSIAKNRLHAHRLSVLNGVVIMDTALTVDTVDVSYSGLMQFDTTAQTSDTVRFLTGSGSINFGNTILCTDSTLMLSSFSGLGGNATLLFFNDDSVMFEAPINPFLIRKVMMYGSGKVQTGAYALTVSKLFLYNGFWQCNPTSDSIADTLGIFGGTLLLGATTLRVNNMTGNAGTVRFNTGTLQLTGDNGTFDFGGLNSLYADSGTVVVSGGTNARYNLFPSVSSVMPGLQVNAGTSDTVFVKGNMHLLSLRHNNGTFDWGTGLSHIVDTLYGNGGTMNFRDALIEISQGNADFSGVTTIDDNGAVLRFTGSGTQELLPSPDTLPTISKYGTGSLAVSNTIMLRCRSLEITDGVFNCNSGNLDINGSLHIAATLTTPLIGTDGITVNVTGNAQLSGQAGTILQIVPATTMQLAVGGTLSASYAAIGNCNAAATQGTADLTCTNAGGNTNWFFLADDVTPPSGISLSIVDADGYANDGDPLLQLVATGADSMRIAVAADTQTAPWKVYSATDSITISSGGDGEKFVFVQFKDLSGNRSDWTHDSTIYDVTAPTAGQIVIVDNSGYTNDGDPLLQLVATGADSMRIALAADTQSASWKSYASTDSITISSGGDGEKFVFVQFRDRADNRSGWMHDSTMYDTKSPSNPQIVINDAAGATNDADPRLQLSATDADSMRTAVLKDTAGAAWRAMTSTDSILIDKNGEGQVIVAAQYKNRAGTRSVWCFDTTIYDLTAPVVAKLTSGQFTEATWSGSVNGETNDAVSGTDAVTVSVRRTSDSYYWDGSVWQETVSESNYTGDGPWSWSLPFTALDDDEYEVSVTASDKAGNGAGSASLSVFSYIPRPDALFSCTPTRGPAPLDVSFADTSVGQATSRSWLFGDGSTDTSAQTVHRYTQYGDYTVRLAVEGPGGVDTLTVDALVHALPPPPSAALSVSVISGSAPLSVTFNDLSTGQIVSRLWNFGDGTTSTTTGPFHVYRSAGTFTAVLIVTGAGGNDTAVSSAITVTDTTAPASLQGLTAMTPECSTIVVSWKQPSESDADSIAFTLDDTGYAALYANGALHHVCSSVLTRDTIRGIRLNGGTLYIRGYVVDASGNRSTVGQASQCTVIMGDCTPPPYALSVSISAPGDTALLLSVVTDPQAENPAWVRHGVGPSPAAARDSSSEDAFGGSLTQRLSVRIPGWWYSAMSVGDTAGNFSSVHYDSILVADMPPVLSLGDTATITEDRLWTRSIAYSDYNGDSVTVKLQTSPTGATLRNDTLFWQPDDRDIGAVVVTVSATDARGAVTYDSLYLKVLNNEEPPVVTFSGDTAAFEDMTWTALLSVNDPDPSEMHTVNTVRIPAWITLKGDTLHGVPKEDDAGSDTIVCIVSDRTGLSDTMVTTIRVYAVNDTPSITDAGTSDSVMYEKDTLVFSVTVADPDRGDSVAVFWQNRPAWAEITSGLRDTVARTTRFSFTLAPMQTDTGTHAFGIIFSDRSAASCALGKKIIVKDADDAPSQPKITRLTATGAVQYTAVSKDDRDSVIVFEAVLQATDDTSFILRKTSINGQFRFYPLDDGTYIFRVTATDAQEHRSQPAFDTLSIQGASRHSTADTAWEMISLPQTKQVSVAKNTKYLLHWDESVNEKQVYHYYLQKDEIDSLRAGYSYWRKGAARDTIHLSFRNTVTAPVAVTLTARQQGWNQIASPYPYPVVWRGDDRALWKWNSRKGDFEEADSVLEPWQGYWYQCDSSTTVTIDTVPRFSSSRLAKKKKVCFTDVNNWMFNLVLQTDGGSDAENRFGIRSDAENGFDRYDRLEPPRIVAGGSLYFPHANWKKGITQYSTDVRKSWADINVFEFCITGTSGNSDAHLRIDGFDAGTPLYFYLSGADTLTEIKAGDSIPVVLQTEALYKTLFVVKDPSRMQLVPLRFGMGNPYPNPFCPTTKIQYVLPYRWEKNGKLIDTEYRVSIDIYDMLGRKVRNLVYRSMKPGKYQVLWDGKTESGRRLASGNYFIRLKADTFEGVRKLVMVR